MKYKVGDKVRIKSLDWYNENKTSEDCLVCSSAHINSEMICMLGKIVTISSVEEDHYRIKEYAWNWTDEMFEGLVEEETNDCEKCGLNRNSIRCLFMDNCPYNKQKNIIEIPDGYELKDENGNIINASKIVLEKKKPKYPKTYEECLKVLDIEGNRLLLYNSGITQYERDLYLKMNSLSKLLICRDAYWKIAGEEMGLGKPWEPGDNKVFGIIRQHGKIQKYNDFVGGSTILEFPTLEMRDAFYENFKEEIEICKELL